MSVPCRALIERIWRPAGLHVCRVEDSEERLELDCLINRLERLPPAFRTLENERKLYLAKDRLSEILASGWQLYQELERRRMAAQRLSVSLAVVHVAARVLPRQRARRATIRRAAAAAASDGSSSDPPPPPWAAPRRARGGRP